MDSNVVFGWPIWWWNQNEHSLPSLQPRKCLFFSGRSGQLIQNDSSTTTMVNHDDAAPLSSSLLCTGLQLFPRPLDPLAISLDQIFSMFLRNCASIMPCLSSFTGSPPFLNFRRAKWRISFSLYWDPNISLLDRLFFPRKSRLSIGLLLLSL